MSSALIRQLFQALDFMPGHRGRSSRTAMLSLDTLLDESREQLEGGLSAGTLDFVLMGYRYSHLFERELERFSKQKVRPELLKDLLQLAFAAVLTRDKIPPSALVSESVEVAKKRLGPHTAAFTNAFLRQTLRNKDSLLAELESRPEVLLGPVLLKRWEKTGLALGAIARNLAHRPESGIWAFSKSESLRRLTKDEFFQDEGGPRQAMDPGSWSFCEWLSKNLANAQKKITVLDACAAPGGKLLALQKLFTEQKIDADFYATDAKFPRLKKLKENLQRWNALSPTALYAWGDAKSDLVLPNDWPAKFDVVLADLPCSGSGTLATRPDLLLENLDARIQDLRPLQSVLIEDLKKKVAPGGSLVVSLCSIDPFELNGISTALGGKAADFLSYSALKAYDCEGISGWIASA